MRYGERFPALEYLDGQSEEVWATFLAYSKYFGESGPLPGVSRGRWLRGKYGGIYEFKPAAHRVFVFLD
jgi:hypothetical protein